MVADIQYKPWLSANDTIEVCIPAFQTYLSFVIKTSRFHGLRINLSLAGIAFMQAEIVKCKTSHQWIKTNDTQAEFTENSSFLFAKSLPLDRRHTQEIPYLGNSM